jgi:hypothetical protein
MKLSWAPWLSIAFAFVFLASGGVGARGGISPAAPSLLTAAPVASGAGTSEASAAAVSPAPPSLAESTLPAALVPKLVYDGPTPLHLPPAWGNSGLPPGAPIPLTPAGQSGASFQQSWSHNGAYPYVDGTCVGKWPSGGQSYYSGGCIGHDEPAINPYSNLPGSGGNVSWNVSLPIDGGSTHNQSDIYIAIWFGMNLYDPFGYNGQCFLELQMYPDTNGSGLPQVGKWSAFAVAWQIELATGAEDPCYAAPLFETGGSTPLEMNAGDHLYVNMTGWVGSPLGEAIHVADTSTGVTSFLRLYNTTGHYPLDPAYAENNVDDALPWSPGGDLPVSFAFESGHTVDDPENDTFGGCNTGAPPPTPLNPSTPCGPYNPKDWATDTKVPWHFYSVSFFNAKHRQLASQFGFEQDFGATAWIDGLSYGTCTGRDGSAYCSYPWYSYSSTDGAFEFGATDYTGTTQDFGQYNEYDPSLQTDSSGLNFYPVRNFTYADPTGATLSVRVNGTGGVQFLASRVTGSSNFGELPPGSYSVNALPATGSYFEGYTVTGGVSVSTPGTAWNSLEIHSSGTLTAVFGTTAPATSAVKFADAGNHGEVTVVPGFSFALAALDPPAGPGFGLLPVFSSSPTQVVNGGTLHLEPGIYSIEANPRPGYSFTGWSSSSPGIYLYAPATNYTWVNVTGTSGTITAHYSATNERALIWLTAYPHQGGSIIFAGHNRGASAVLPDAVGTYSISAVASPGYSFLGWAGGFMSTLTDFGPNSTVLVQNGSDWLTAAFSSDPVLADAGVHGSFALNGALIASTVTLPQVGDKSYQVEAVPNAGYRFVAWNASPSSNLTVAHSGSSVSAILVDGSARLTPIFALSVAPSATISFVAHGGTIGFNVLNSFHGSAKLGGIAPGVYYISERPDPGYSFAGWSTSGVLSVKLTYLLNSSSFADVENLAGVWNAWYRLAVNGSGQLTATFHRTTDPVTFIDFPFDATVMAKITSAHGTTLILHAGHTANLRPGTYTLTLLGNGTHLRWFATSNLTLGLPFSNRTSLVVDGSGAIYVVGVTHHLVSGGGRAAAPAHFPGAATFSDATRTVVTRREN